MGTADRILRNGVWLATGQICARTIGLAYTVFLARTLGVDMFGTYSFVAITVLMGGLLSDAGLSRLTIREVAAGTQSPRFLATVNTVRALCSVVAYAGVVAALHVLQYPPDLVWLVMVGGLSLLPSGFAQVADGVYQAEERMDVVAALQTLYTILNAGLGVAALLAGGGLLGVIVAWVTASTVHAVVYSVLLHRTWTLLAVRVRPAEVLSILRAAAPLAVQALLAVVYYRAGPLAVGWLRGERDLGVYAAAHRVAEGLILFPAVFTMVLLPGMVRMHREDLPGLRRLYVAAQRAAIVLLCPLAVIGIVYGQECMDLLYSSRFALAGPPFTLLMGGLVFSFLHASNAAVVLSAPALGSVVRRSVGTTALAVALNLALVPAQGPVGAAMAHLVAEAASFLVFLGLVFSQLRISPRAFLGAIGKPVTALVFLAGVLVIGRGWAPLGTLVVAPALYALVVWGIGIAKPEEVSLVRGLLARTLRSFPRD